jgi:hypothetical protein
MDNDTTYNDSIYGPSGQWEGDVALFIDWEDVKSRLHSAGKTPNVTALVETCGRFGRLVLARAYADWEDPFHFDSRDMLNLYQAGIEPVFVPNPSEEERSGREKSAAQERLGVDCLDSSFTYRNIFAYVLVSSDAGLLPLVNSLRSRGKRVVLIALTDSDSLPIGQWVDDLLDYEQDVDGHRARYSRAFQDVEKGDLDAALKGLVSLVREQREDGRYPLLSWLGHQMRRHVPDFSPQAYGFEKFKDLVKYAEQQGAIKIVTQGLVDWAVLPEDDIPESALEEAARLAAPGQSSGLLEAGGDATPYPFTVGTHPILDSPNPIEDYGEIFADIVKTADEIENDDRYDFMTPGFLGQCLWRKGHWDPATLPPGTVPASDLLKELRAGQIRKLVDYAVDEGLLLSTLRYDPNTGKTFPIIRLNPSHPFVKSAFDDESAN